MVSGGGGGGGESSLQGWLLEENRRVNCSAMNHQASVTTTVVAVSEQGILFTGATHFVNIINN